jgi:prolipoprotein diacylglyceryltransferase
MYRPDQYLAVVVGLMFVAGILVAIYSARRRARLRMRGLK